MNTTSVLSRMTGIADEADRLLAQQIEAHKALGWEAIELRSIEGTNITQLSDEAFDQAYRQMEDAGMRCAGFASAIANWARPVTGDFRQDIDDLNRSIPRMKKINTRFIRIMSYPNDNLNAADWKREVFRRLGELVKIAEDAGIVLLHENCDGWGAQSPAHLREILEHFSSPAFRMVFDSGNAIQHGGSKEDNWGFYRAALPYIDHFHIKDCLLDGAGFTMPGEGDCEVEAIIRDLHARGYKGLFSIEPHIAMVIHKDGGSSASANQAEVYCQYGQKANHLVSRALQAASSK